MTRSNNRLASMALGLGCIAGVAVGTIVLHERASRARPEPAVRVLPVRVEPAAAVAGHYVTEHFVGRLEPARATRIAFERPGVVATVLVEEGVLVDAGEPIASLDDRGLAADRQRLQGERQRIVAELELARLTRARQERLRADGHAAQQRVDEARLASEALEGALIAIEAALDRIDIDLQKSTLHAPYAGRIAGRYVHPGAVLDAGDAVVELLETSRPRARISLPPEVARQLVLGETVSIHAAGRDHAGVVATIRPDLSARTRTTSVLVDLAHADGLIFGDVVRVERRRWIEGAGYWLPLTALTEGERGLWSILTVVDRNGWTVARNAVEVLHAEADRVFVRGSLAEGELVLRSGADRVVPGQRVVPVVALGGEADAG